MSITKDTSLQNPEQTCLSARQIYQYDTHRNIPWNVVEYQPLKTYQDPIEIKLQRKYEEMNKKGEIEKDTKHLTKKGFYMDYHLKVVKELPAPSNYKLNDAWLLTEDEKKKAQGRKIDSSLSKYTYIDGIVNEEKKRSKPGVGTYSLNKSESNIKEELAKWKTKKQFIGPKRFFYEDG